MLSKSEKSTVFCETLGTPETLFGPRNARSTIFQCVCWPRDKPGYHGTGSARDWRACKQCKRSKSSESSKKDKSGSDKTTRSSNARVARLSPEPTQLAETIAYALLGRCAAYAGRFEEGACRSQRASESASFLGKRPTSSGQTEANVEEGGDKRAARSTRRNANGSKNVRRGVSKIS